MSRVIEEIHARVTEGEGSIAHVFLWATAANRFFLPQSSCTIIGNKYPIAERLQFWFHHADGEWLLLAVRSVLRSDSYASTFILLLGLYDYLVRP